MSRIGIDLDNTIVNHDDSFLAAAHALGLLPGGFVGQKRQVRDAVRARGQAGELAWQKLQGQVYGRGMAQARLMEGCAPFLRRCRETRGVTVVIVSHRTRLGHFDPDGVDLRQAARAWLREQGIDEPVFFETTRRDKVERIRALGCDVFIDDLVEVFEEPGFPEGVRKILHAPVAEEGRAAGTVCATWSEIEDEIFGPPELRPLVARMLDRQAGELQLVRAGGGGNSKVYRVDDGDAGHALKVYPTEDGRDRGGVERAALQLFARHGVGCVPAWRAGEGNVALLEWIEGSPVGKPAAGDIDAAAAFIGRVKELGETDGEGFALAAEACLSGDEILRQLDRRQERLREDPALRQFLLEHFLPARAAAEASARAAGLSFATPLAVEKRCLIPADLGFHNALREARSGRLVFFDFEYLGWDDPAKLVADFLLHPGHQLSGELKDRFTRHMEALFAGDPDFGPRLRVLLPLFALRWALILLQRRDAGQLGKARAVLEAGGLCR